MHELADVGPTDADGGDPDQELTLARLGNRSVVDPDISRPVVPNRSHSWPPIGNAPTVRRPRVVVHTGRRMSASSPARIGFVGLGRMGSRIAANLAKTGHEVTVWNRTGSVAEDWAGESGGVVAGSLADLARSEFIITMLADGDALEEVYGELAGSLGPEVVAVDMGTSGPESFEKARALVEAREQPWWTPRSRGRPRPPKRRRFS